MKSNGSMTLLDVELLAQKVIDLTSRVERQEEEIAFLRRCAKTGGFYDFAEQVTGYPRGTLYNKVSQKKIPYEVRLGKPWFNLADLDAWMDDPSYNEQYWEAKMIEDLRIKNKVA